jgi:hypothetical protein
MTVITVSTPLCAPSRETITGTLRKELEPYGFVLRGVTAEEIPRSHWLIRVDVSDDADEWCEYVLLRLDYFRVGKCLNAKNQGWANKYLESQPTGYAPGCKNKPKGATVVGERCRANPPPPWSGRYDYEHKGNGKRKSSKRKEKQVTPAWSSLKRMFSEFIG